HAESRGHHHLGRVIADGVPIHLGQGPGQVGGEAPQLVVARRGRTRELLPLGPDREDYTATRPPSTRSAMRSATHAERSGESPRRRSHEMSGAAEEAMRSATKSGITTT